MIFKHETTGELAEISHIGIYQEDIQIIVKSYIDDKHYINKDDSRYNEVRIDISKATINLIKSNFNNQAVDSKSIIDNIIDTISTILLENELLNYELYNI